MQGLYIINRMGLALRTWSSELELNPATVFFVQLSTPGVQGLGVSGFRIHGFGFRV